LIESNPLASIQLTCPFLSLPQKFRIVSGSISFLVGMDPLKKTDPGFLWKLRNGFLNFLDRAHGE
jgi:hypothetical protein